MSRLQLTSKEQSFTDLAHRIRDARKDAHLSQYELSQEIGVSDKSVSAYEKGRSIPPIEKLKKIASATNHPLAFFTDDDQKDGNIEAKLNAIEKELTEVKLLLLNKTK